MNEELKKEPLLSGNFNFCVGPHAGANLTTESNQLCINDDFRVTMTPEQAESMRQAVKIIEERATLAERKRCAEIAREICQHKKGKYIKCEYGDAPEHIATAIEKGEV